MKTGEWLRTSPTKELEEVLEVLRSSDSPTLRKLVYRALCTMILAEHPEGLTPGQLGRKVKLLCKLARLELWRRDGGIVLSDPWGTLAASERVLVVLKGE